MSAPTLASRTKPGYEERVRLAAAAIRQNSPLGEEDARSLAIQVLRAVDHIPEKIR
ncbi:hypothetical protein GCM10023321_47430 [Pseudonocardia eucalypti]|uniref:Uncharacterized protein n=1 Tax=Pseudonocardia eucalypti TaxID=648755 RepID=A0ABP9QHX0_9PSEU|nr:hypothetical protein [Pseudonocardia eucalypti]